RYRSIAARIDAASKRHADPEPSLDDVVGRVRAQLGDELAEVTKKLEGIVERKTPVSQTPAKSAKKRTTKGTTRKKDVADETPPTDEGSTEG
ncbi:MAG: hypothetical protein KDA28_15515, partial [Phycisphaerales bacterium]|nr:hypothetical protein [Phycisphaerales bacterium]